MGKKGRLGGKGKGQVYLKDRMKQKPGCRWDAAQPQPQRSAASFWEHCLGCWGEWWEGGEHE